MLSMLIVRQGWAPKCQSLQLPAGMDASNGSNFWQEIENGVWKVIGNLKLGKANLLWSKHVEPTIKKMRQLCPAEEDAWGG